MYKRQGYTLTFSADGLEPATSEEFYVVAAAPASFTLHVDGNFGGDFEDNLQFTFSNFKDEWDNNINNINDRNLDPAESFITLVANEEETEDISVSLVDLPAFAVDGGTMTVTMEAKDILSLAGGEGYFDGLDLNVHTTVDAELSGDEWKIEGITAELPDFPADGLNAIFVDMIDAALLPVEDALGDEKDLLAWDDVEVGPDHWERQTVNLNNLRIHKSLVQLSTHYPLQPVLPLHGASFYRTDICIHQQSRCKLSSPHEIYHLCNSCLLYTSRCV